MAVPGGLTTQRRPLGAWALLAQPDGPPGLPVSLEREVSSHSALGGTQGDPLTL